MKNTFVFIISGIAFFLLNYQLRSAYIVGIAIAVITLIVLSLRYRLTDVCPNSEKGIKVIAALSACGVIICDGRLFYATVLTWDKAAKVTELLGCNLETLVLLIAILGGIAAFYFVYVLHCIFYAKFGTAIIQLFSRLEKMEQLFLMICFGVGCIMIIGCYALSNAWYGPENSVDIIYTFDSGEIYHKNCYLWLASGQNDLRQPLFAVFTAPFLGIFYLMSLLIPIDAAGAVCLQIGQWGLLLLAYMMLSELLELRTHNRIMFVTMILLTYPSMLFGLAMEQYIMVLFWMMFFLYNVYKKKEDIHIFIGTVGTLLTNAVWFPLLLRKNDTCKNALRKFGCVFLIGIVYILLFCRFDVIYHALDTISGVMSFTGEKLLFTERLKQYLNFILACFVAPQAGIVSSAEGSSWQLSLALDYNMAGCILMILILVSFLLNRGTAVCRWMFGWCMYSFILLGLLGYGTAENGLVLYTLYFGWAFWGLLYKLIEKIWNYRLRMAIYAAIAVVFMMINLPKIVELVQFVNQYYPAS